MRWGSKTVWVAGAGLIAAATLPFAAWADHGKAGLWTITVTMDQDSPAAHFSAADRAQMKAMGISMPNSHTISTQHCMTAKAVHADALNSISEPGCTLENKSANGQTYSADMVCNGDLKGKGHIQVTYDKPEHYSGEMTFTGESHGHPANMSQTYEGQWVKADCGNVDH